MCGFHFIPSAEYSLYHSLFHRGAFYNRERLHNRRLNIVVIIVVVVLLGIVNGIAALHCPFFDGHFVAVGTGLDHQGIVANGNYTSADTALQDKVLTVERTRS